MFGNPVELVFRQRPFKNAGAQVGIFLFRLGGGFGLCRGGPGGSGGFRTNLISQIAQLLHGLGNGLAKFVVGLLYSLGGGAAVLFALGHGHGQRVHRFLLQEGSQPAQGVPIDFAAGFDQALQKFGADEGSQPGQIPGREAAGIAANHFLQRGPAHEGGHLDDLLHVQGLVFGCLRLGLFCLGFFVRHGFRFACVAVGLRFRGFGHAALAQNVLGVQFQHDGLFPGVLVRGFIGILVGVFMGIVLGFQYVSHVAVEQLLQGDAEHAGKLH